MDLYIFSDESGVFDKAHNDTYVYGGLIFTSKDEKDNYNRKYLSAERNIARAYTQGAELKACRIRNKHKLKLFNATNDCIRFGAVVDEQRLLDSIFATKKDRQRYLDYAYKISLKNAFLGMKEDKLIRFEDIHNLYLSIDEHTTATNGLYELREGLIQEFKTGTHNYTYDKYFPPIFPNLKSVHVQYCNSDNVALVRASDIIANRLFYLTVSGSAIEEKRYLYIKRFP